ncbi:MULTISPECIES: hypothetical protein [unclassified Brenneria]|uniref:hypothetical protein n=1 Tax=unclassified Brenneria TaxID=2634434 RepID=UPI0029C13E32|nr:MULTISPECIES: hypothetical protein [unclassified Brenneria]MDX5629075.1 hypothetical protein [Brenneria sp. L3-3Z]MDX5696214.1 hypothetical protein [Brenneria sp. L4-2C]
MVADLYYAQSRLAEIGRSFGCPATRPTLIQLGYALGVLLIGIFLADVAAQGLQVTHQSVLYRLAPEARSRITAVFVTSGFVGMSLGTALASLGYARLGSTGVCLIGAAFPAVLVLHWLWRAAGIKPF